MHAAYARHATHLFVTLTSLLLALQGCDGKKIDPSELEERCTDGIDNNGDGLSDCEDPSCAIFATCSGGEHCYNGLDDNGDGDIDCQDERCKGTFLCSPNVEDCANGLDDDGDGDTDCQDDACARTSICESGREACVGGVDEDGDGDVDCDDDDCKAVFICLSNIELLGNSIDDDGDGDTDCDDEDYARTSECSDLGENCGNDVDDDGDGAADCQDPDCAQTADCLRPAELCGNGLDDDLNGDTDCDDDSCSGHPTCLDEICTDNTDNDQDGDVDCADEDCYTSAACLATSMPELCDDGIDNDDNGDIDCADTACEDAAACEEICDDGVDNDEDGDLDCLDSECLNSSTCEEICDDDIDNDADEDVDCDDEECGSLDRCQCANDGQITSAVHGQVADCTVAACLASDASCQQGLTDELCAGDGIDNDGDGYVDCADMDCFGFNDGACPELECTATVQDLDGLDIPDCSDPTCAQLDDSCQVGLAEERCDGDGVDNDGDGLTDCQDIDDCGDTSYCQCPQSIETGEAESCDDIRCTEDAKCNCDDAGFITTERWGLVPNCNEPSCQQAYEGCQAGPVELCDGFDFDNDGNGTTDCADVDACGMFSQCQCPSPGDLSSCMTDAFCAATPFCGCALNYKDNGQGVSIPDCDRSDCSGDLTCQTNLDDELCNGDGVDNDGDGYVDCDDAACDGSAFCGTLTCDVLDCNDPICQQLETACMPNMNEICEGNFDNDGDGDTSCQDDECVGDPACPCPDVTSPDCSNALCGNEPACVCQDNLKPSPFGLIPNCTLQACIDTDPTCAEPAPEACLGDGVDNDQDGFTDCADADCFGVGNAASSCPTLACEKTKQVLDGLFIPDCGDSVCVQTDSSCQTNLDDELCEGDGVDNDGDNLVDCDDALDCGGEPYCQCPLDSQTTLPLDCSDVRCQTNPYCECLNASTTVDLDGVPRPDCINNMALCGGLPECQTSQPEFCEDDGIDNDGDGLIDCDDPDCHAFNDDSNYCTRKLCGDPQNNFQVIVYGDFDSDGEGDPSDLLIDSSTAMAMHFPNTPGVGATVKQGDLSIIGSAPFDLPESRLRCVLPAIGGNVGVNNTVFIDAVSLNDRTGLNTLTVATSLEWRRDQNEMGMAGLSELRQVLHRLTVAEPAYTVNPPDIEFTGLDELRRVGLDIELLPELLNFTQPGWPSQGDYTGTPVSFAGLDNLVETGDNLITTYNYDAFGTQQLSTEHGCELLDEESQSGVYSPVQGNSAHITSFAGLGSLRRIGRDLCVYSSDMNMVLSALSSLETIGEDFLFKDPAEFSPITTIVSFQGLQNLNLIGGSFGMGGGFSSGGPRFIVQDYQGLSGLTRIDKHFRTTTAESFQIPDGFIDFNGLDSLNEIGGDFQLLGGETGSHPMTSSEPFTSLTSLTSIGGALVLYSTSTTKLSGLGGLTSLGGLKLYRNDLLTDVDTLNGITELGHGSLVVQESGPSFILDGLSGVTRVEGDVHVDKKNLLNALSNLTWINETLYLNNSNVTSVSAALPLTLTYLGGLYVENNTNFTSMTGFPANQTELQGDLVLVGGGFGNMDLSVLNTITLIEGHVSLRQGHSDLSFLSSLQRVKGLFEVLDNAPLTSLSGLGNLVEVGGDLFVQYNNNLINLSGLHNVQSVHGKMGIDQNPLLLSLNLNSLSEVRGEVSITGTGIASLTGLGSLFTVEQDLLIHNNNNLTSLAGLVNLTTIGGSLRLSNSALSDISALSSLQAVHGIEILSAELTSLNGLQNIPAVIEGPLTITGQPFLTDISALSHISEARGGLSIANNDSLTSLADLMNLSVIGGFTIAINLNDSLVDVSALNNVTTLLNPNVNLSMFGNTSLCSSNADAVKNYYSLMLGHTGPSNFSNNTGPCP